MHFRITRSSVFGPVLNEVSCPFNPKSSPVSHGPLILGYFSSLHLLMPEIILNNIYVFVLCPLPPPFTPLECMFFVGKSFSLLHSLLYLQHLNKFLDLVGPTKYLTEGYMAGDRWVDEDRGRPQYTYWLLITSCYFFK